jgi:nicotinamide mononucleotide transporter
MTINELLSHNLIEIFGVITGIIYVILEIRQNIWLWPVGIITSAVYIIVFFTSKFYAEMILQGYYLVISCLGLYWWGRYKGNTDKEHYSQKESKGGNEQLHVTRLTLKSGMVLLIVVIILYFLMWIILSRLTDSPVPEWDSFITSFSVIATWMLARKIYEHWFLWIIVNAASVIAFVSRGLYPTVVLYMVYLVMSFAGLKVWKHSIGRKINL